MSPFGAAPFPVSESTVVAPEVPGPTGAGRAIRVCRPLVDAWEGRPGVLVVGDDQPDQMVEGLAACGAVVMAIEGEVPQDVPAALALVQAALGWARSSACDVGFDPDCLGVLGTGSGAYLAPWVALSEDSGDCPPLEWAAALASTPWPEGLPIFLPDDRPASALPRLWIGQVGTAPGDGRPSLRNWARAYLMAGGDAELEMFSGTDAAVTACVARVADFLTRQAPAGLVPFASA